MPAEARCCPEYFVMPAEARCCAEYFVMPAEARCCPEYFVMPAEARCCPEYFVMPAEAGIQRLKSLDYRIHPCILPLRASRWLFKSAPGRFSPAKNMLE